MIATRLAYATSRVGEEMQLGFRPGVVARNNKPAMVLAGLHGGVITRQSWRGEAEQSPCFRRRENRMQASFWIELWKKSEIGFHKSDIDTNLMQFWSRLALQPDQQVFVPLCGKSLDMLWLAGQGLKVVGVELSPLACEAFFAENNLTPRRCREESLRFGRPMKSASFRATSSTWEGSTSPIALAFMTALRLSRSLQRCANATFGILTPILPAAAEILLLTMEFDQAERPGPPFAVSEAEVRSLYEPAYEVKHLHAKDSFSPHSHLACQGLTWLEERVYRIVRR